jgi:hypothetical protein
MQHLRDHQNNYYQQVLSTLSIVVLKMSTSALLPWLAALAYPAVAPANDTVYLTVSYCPTAFTGKGAVVKVEHSGKFQIVDKFDLPSVSIGCPMMESVNFMTDPHPRTSQKPELQGRRTHWSWTSEWGYLSVIDLDKGKVSHQVKGSSTDLNIFDGFTNFKVGNKDASENIGLSPHVTEDGFCDDGCFRAGTQYIEDGAFKHLSGDDEKHTGALPFKAVMSDTSFHDPVAGVYYAQGSYPLNEAARCDPDDTAQCMFAINTTTGASKPSLAERARALPLTTFGPSTSDPIPPTLHLPSSYSSSIPTSVAPPPTLPLLTPPPSPPTRITQALSSLASERPTSRCTSTRTGRSPRTAPSWRGALASRTRAAKTSTPSRLRGSIWQAQSPS